MILTKNKDNIFFVTRNKLHKNNAVKEECRKSGDKKGRYNFGNKE